MSFLKKTVSLIAIFSAIPAAYAVTARPSVLGAAGPRRMPTMATQISGLTGSGTSSSNTSSNLLANAECIEAYTECIKSEDACGPDFEECTTRKLFHGQMPECLSVLGQCSASGVSSLFGTNNISALSNVKTTDSKTGEILDYTYPTDGSVLGQWITAAAINNQYDTSTCVKRYTSCLHKDSVCGADFELCTTAKEFRKQALFCDSTLARCQSAGVTELLGTYPWTPSTATIGGRVSTMIEEGAQLAAMNAVSTCYKVVEQCFLGACTANPFRCIEGSTLNKITAANLASDEETTSVDASTASTGTLSKSEVNRYLKTACLDTIGSNKYCHMTFREKTPTKGELSDVDAQEEVFEAAIDQRKKYVDSKIQDVMQKFDTKAKDKCTETIRTCAMRTCGEGVGSVCYTSVFNGSNESINKELTRNEIKRGCESIVNTDANCQYAYASIKDTAYSYSYINDSVFDTLFPEYDEMTKNDPIGVVAGLNASLANNYSMAAIAEMKKQCQSVATSCVKSMCGTDYVNCYRNRTDIYSNLTSSGDDTFDKSMNKVGGVLDYTVVLGLCINTVKNADVCDEHLKIEQARLKQNSNFSNSWGDQGSVRDGWVDAGGSKTVTAETETIQSIDANGNKLCTNSKGEEGICYEVDSTGDVFNKPVMESYTTYLSTQAANTLFRELITDIEYEAQAKYNAKLTKQQNMCMSSNTGGVMGNRDQASTFMWVKLKSSKVPTNYSVAGLKPNQMVASNDLYGSFCRVRVSLQSDDKRIQDALRDGENWAVAYFAAGDTFTCGSWIPSEKLEEIADAVASEAVADKADSQKRTRTWVTVASALGSTIGGGYLTNSMQDGDFLGGLIGNKAKKADEKDKDYWKKQCVNMVDLYNQTPDYQYARYAVSAAKELGVSTADAEKLITAYDAAPATCSGTSDAKCQTAIKSAQAGQMMTAVTNLKTACEKMANVDANSKEDEAAAKKENRKRSLINMAGAAVVGTAGTLIVNRLTKDIQDANLDADKKKAYNEWMDNVGKHIHCYIGGDEAGQYGDIITTSME